MQVDFYHLTATPLDRALPRIAERVIASGGRLLIVSGSEEQRRHLDRLLWSYAPDSFLPHGEAGAGEDASQPILLAGDASAANAARNIALVDGLWRDAALDFDRAFHFFDDEAIEAAREAWKALGGRDGIERRYWIQGEGGRWEQAA
ncbi:DNA polymerase III subunit chi [Sphingomonas metalli]|uniref:DNA polymerase III subunit chi n=1 Tax=Sphingomonas metalli TaxID=1779358 RepID=A0A916WT70_9SPHN|nr:DNA polymerase III subunit chi [Sphingomonas metalli]GGB32383.1 DNA polymerase III subunit chi [Sphingomonas metalli]